MRARRTAAVVVAIVLAGIIALPVAAAANTLSDPRVTPSEGTTETTFEFSVHYEGSAPTSVVAVWGTNDELVLTRSAGQATNGTYSAATRLPAGTHQVRFRVTVPQGAGRNHEIAGPTVEVTEVSGPSAPPTPPPTQPPTPAPTAQPTSTPPGATRSPSATPLAPTPLPPITTLSPFGSPSGTADSSGTPLASGFIGGVVVTPRGDATASPAPAPAQAGDRRPGGGGVWTLVGGGMLAIGLLAVLAMVGLLRTRRELPATAMASGGPPAAAVLTPAPIVWEDDYPAGVASMAPPGDDVIARS